MLKNLKVTTKIAAGFGLILILLAVTAGQGILKLTYSQSTQAVQELAKMSGELSSLIGELRSS